MKPLNQTEDRIRQAKSEIETPAAMDSRILMDSYAVMGSQPSVSTPSGHHIRRILMKNTIKFTAAAIILIAATLSLTLFDKTVPSAYALEQTIQACHSVKSIHIRLMKTSGSSDPKLIWAEFLDNGQPKAIRIHFPGIGDGIPENQRPGAKVTIWKNNTATVWWKKKKLLLTVPEKKFADEILKMVKENDPKNIVQNLYDQQQEGKVEIQTEIPDDKSEPIVITATFLPERKTRRILYVDQATQLVMSEETYDLRPDGYIKVKTSEFYDYNQLIEPNMFTFDNLPADVIRVDQVANLVGLEQGQMTDNEVAVETARKFWQAIVDEDFDRAGKYLEGAPGSQIKKVFQGKFKGEFVEIVSVGPVQKNPQKNFLVVPCTLKIEKNGKIEEMTFDHIGVRQVYNQPRRWTIFGGL